jgi:hypothetical protein
MRHVRLFALLLLTPVLSGCAASDLISGMFDNYYSGGGTTSSDRRYHQQQQIEAWDSYNRYGSAR